MAKLSIRVVPSNARHRSRKTTDSPSPRTDSEKAKPVSTDIQNGETRTRRKNLDFHLPASLISELKRLYDTKQFDALEKRLPEVLGSFPNSPVLWNYRGLLSKRAGETEDAVDAFQRVVQIAPNSPQGHNNLGTALKSQGNLEKAIKCYQKALKLYPNYLEALNNLGNALRGQGKYRDAVLAYKKALKLKPDSSVALENLGGTLVAYGKPIEAIASYKRALKVRPGHPSTIAQMLHQMQHICDWNDAASHSNSLVDLGVTTTPVPPFAILSMEDNPERQMRRSENWARSEFSQRSLQYPASARTSIPERLRIGYFSADFHDHATLYLMSGLLREHDTARFEIFAYSYGTATAGHMRKEAEQTVEHFFDVHTESDGDIVDMARRHELDIAIDLKGYTRDSRSELFAYRLAPIQMNFLGYPGTMGAPFMDYIIADKVVIPKTHRKFYSESIIYLPNCYQPNDNKREIGKSEKGRGEFGLPEDAFVFCCFNNNYKIGPREFDIWMELLRQINGSVLWLLLSNTWAKENLRKAAEARGVSGDRLVFAEGLPHAQHLARHSHADLFLDTFNYNAHTTASDALWSGLPIVTKCGEQFSARVAASLLKAAGLSELITKSDEEYKELAIDLAKDRARLHAIRRRLASHPERLPLFDTISYSRSFESALNTVHRLHVSGNAPEDIEVDGLAITQN